MAITRIESVTYGVDELAGSSRFVEDFGLERTDTRDDRVTFRTQVNQRVRLVDTRARDLPRGLEDGSTLCETIWGVDTPAALDALHDDLSRDRAVRADSDGVLHSFDETGYAIGFMLARPAAAVERVRHPAAGTRDALLHWDRAFDAYTRVSPLRLARLTLEIPEEGRDAAIEFYRRRLGFEINAYRQGAGTFLRCEAGGARHGLVLSERANRPGVDSVVFELRDAAELATGASFMAAQGWRGARRAERERDGVSRSRGFDAPCGGRFDYAVESGDGRGALRYREVSTRQDAPRLDGLLH
ncbi:hypothetical protein [Burkholderia perseverans]|uniref:hypothetical protein n=1 Tax=Burkholderia perseverans TaxID=2615214 RepID=UPI001FEDEDEA|nr:hypothetical protein [Burkholderia perseverans]